MALLLGRRFGGPWMPLSRWVLGRVSGRSRGDSKKTGDTLVPDSAPDPDPCLCQVDSGYHRAGVDPDSPVCLALAGRAQSTPCQP